MKWTMLLILGTKGHKNRQLLIFDYLLKYFDFAFMKFHGNVTGIGNSDIYFI